VSDRKDENSGIASASYAHASPQVSNFYQVIRRLKLQRYFYRNATYTTGTTKEPKPHSLPFGREPQALTPAQLTAQLLLLDFGFRASFFQLLLAGFCVCFRNRFFHGLRCAIDQVFGFFQAQTGDFANCFDDADFVRAEIGQDQVEFGLLFSSCCRTSCCRTADIAAADTPNFSSNALTRSFRSITDISPTAARMSSLLIAI
jgi:hypothetical protein